MIEAKLSLFTGFSLFLILALCSSSLMTFAQDPREKELEIYRTYQEAWETSDLNIRVEKLRKVIVTVPLPGMSLAVHYELGKIYLAMSNYEAAAGEYLWLKEQGELERRQEAAQEGKAPVVTVEPRGGNTIFAMKMKQSEFADELALYLSDLFPKDVAGQFEVTLTPLPGGAEAKTAKVKSAPDAADEKVAAVYPMSTAVRPTITFKVKAKYTEIARLNKVQGTVALNVVFSREGNLTDIKVIRSVPDGLTRKAIEAAQAIRFEPASRDGKPISVRGNLEYTFNLY
jgi:TonB family protein